MDNVEAYDTSTLSCFQQKIKEAISLVPSMTTEDKLKAVQYWNVVSENLQDVVNSSADDISALASQLSERESLIAQEHLKLCNSHLPHYQRTAVHHAFALASRAVNFHHPAIADSVANSRQPDAVNTNVFDLSQKQDSVSVLGPDVLESFLNVQHVDAAIGDGHHVPSLGVDQGGSISDSSELSHSLPGSVADDALDGDAVAIGDHLMAEERGYPHTGPASLGISDIDYSRQQIQQDLNSEDPQMPISQAVEKHVPAGERISVSENNKNLNNSGVQNDAGSGKDNSQTTLKNVISKHGKSSKFIGTVSASSKCCSICKKNCPGDFSHQSSDQRNSKGYVCSHCKKSSSSDPLDLDSFREPTRFGKQPVRCKECNKEFTTISNLNRHMRSHTGYRPFECPECKKRFPEKKSLMVHSRLHSGERPYQCSVCGVRFVQLGGLNYHMEIHANLKQHLCDTCGKPFRQKSSLKLHQLRHEGKKEFQCDKCPMAFNVVSDLKRHSRSHLEDKPFKCEKCSKSFPRLQALTEHRNRHYGNKPYQCTVCSKAFADMSACKKHTKTHNKSKPRAESDPSVSSNGEVIGDHVLGLPAA